MYKLLFDLVLGKQANAVLKIDNNTYIPFDEKNSDYQTYLEWIAQGNTPEPAEVLS